MARTTGHLRAVLLGASASAAWLAAPARGAALPKCPTMSGIDMGLSECGLILSAPSFVALYMDKKCQDPACVRDAAIISAANPNECDWSGFRLYADILDPLRKHCAELARASAAATTPPPPASPTSPTAPTSPPSPAQPQPMSTATPRPTDAPQTVTDPPTTTTSAPQETILPEVSTAPSPTASSVGVGAAEADTDGSNATSTELPVAPTATKSPGRAVSPPSEAPAALGSKHDAGVGATQWVIGAVAACVLLVVVALWVSRQRRRARPKSSSPYEGHSSPRPMGDDMTKKSTKATSASHSSAENDSPFSSTLKQQVDEVLASEELLGAWRLAEGTKLVDKRFLGRGSHAFVHLVELPDRTLVASKRLLASHISLPAIQQLIREAHIVSTLQHRSIVAFLGVAWSSPLDFQLLFEYMAGGDLRAYLDANKPAPCGVPLSVSDSRSGSVGESLSTTISPPREWSRRQLRMALSIAEGLAYAHSFNPPLVHRDLKSRNVLLTQDLEAKISDFGVSRYLSDDATMTTGVGTNRWLAPEVLAGGGTYTEQCDIYSFGVVLTELDTHEVPFAKETSPDRDGVTSRKRTELSLMQGIARGELRPALLASCPVAVRELAIQCLAFDAADRPNALELSHRLRRIVSGR